MRVLNPHVRRPFTGNSVAPPRPPHLSVADHAPRLPVEHHPSQSFPWTLWVMPDQLSPAGENTSGPIGRPSSGPSRGSCANRKPSPRVPTQIYRDPPPFMCCYFMFLMLPSCKIHRNSQKNLKIAKLVLLETRFQTLQLLFMKFDMKLNTFTSILNLKLKGISYITSTFSLCCL
jgi:hypothetical protein